MRNHVQTSIEWKILCSIILLATLSRIAIPPFIGHLPNFSAIDAIALFSGAYFAKRAMACVLVLLSVWIGDLCLNKMFMGHWELFYSGCFWQYGCYILITLLGSQLLKSNISLSRVSAVALFSSILFFAISNFGVWCSGSLYPLTVDGLVACYVAAIPFFKNTLFSDVFFSIVLFGSFQPINTYLKSRLFNTSQ